VDECKPLAPGNASIACSTPRAGAPTATVTIAIDRIAIDDLARLTSHSLE